MGSESSGRKKDRVCSQPIPAKASRRLECGKAEFSRAKGGKGISALEYDTHVGAGKQDAVSAKSASEEQGHGAAERHIVRFKPRGWINRPASPFRGIAE